ncbi:PAN domain-containing protein At5g03700 isoform X2 [Punica granatum]|uniref:PAN domain-containing protein At5g03700 isoform X2 n=1 Tax=Punica granatum TaxID=22663 RepID=A0A6P8C7V6_PUNGR|nr:PAN domain-containing protein At5g03700 isoform X2 [Punica granatum]
MTPDFPDTFLLVLANILLFFAHASSSKSDLRVGYRVTLAVPTTYSPGFTGRAYLLESDKTEPSFRAALSVEAFEPARKYSCSVEVFAGDVKVWNSGHYSRFHVSDVCVLELTADGDLQLKGPNDKIGWRTGTSRQSVEILRTGNLVLADALNNIKWQSFNFPTDVMLWGQRLDVATWLTSFPRNSTFFYSFEIQHDKIALYLNSGQFKYSYWDFAPSKNRNITFLQLGTRGLELFDYPHKKIAQILPSRKPKTEAPRFLALNNESGNMGLYYYSPEDRRFSADFQALNKTCDLPTACRPYGICTFSNACSCIRLGSGSHNGPGSGCENGLSVDPCSGGGPFEMLELDGVSDVLQGGPKRANISKDECTRSCLENCTCLAALYDSRNMGTSECYFYGIMVGIKQVDRGRGLAYMVKVPKGTRSGHGKSNPKKWVLVLVGVVDGIIILAVLGGLFYYLIWKRRKRSSDMGTPPTDNR